MDNFSICSNLIVAVAVLLISCPDQGSGYVSVDYDLSDADSRLLISPWQKGNPRKRMDETKRQGADDGESINKTPLPNIYTDNPGIFNDRVLPPPQPDCQQNGPIPCKEINKEKRINQSYREQRAVRLSNSQSDNANKILVIGEPLMIIVADITPSKL